MQVLDNVRSTATVGETETAHIKQCFQNIYRHSGANPLHNPSLENKKAVNETPVRELKSCGLKLPQRGRDFINGSNCIGSHT